MGEREGVEVVQRLGQGQWMIASETSSLFVLSSSGSKPTLHQLHLVPTNTEGGTAGVPTSMRLGGPMCNGELQQPSPFPFPWLFTVGRAAFQSVSIISNKCSAAHVEGSATMDSEGGLLWVSSAGSIHRMPTAAVSPAQPDDSAHAPGFKRAGITRPRPQDNAANGKHSRSKILHALRPNIGPTGAVEAFDVLRPGMGPHPSAIRCAAWCDDDVCLVAWDYSQSVHGSTTLVGSTGGGTCPGAQCWMPRAGGGKGQDGDTGRLQVVPLPMHGLQAAGSSSAPTAPILALQCATAKAGDRQGQGLGSLDRGLRVGIAADAGGRVLAWDVTGAARPLALLQVRPKSIHGVAVHARLFATVPADPRPPACRGQGTFSSSMGSGSESGGGAGTGATCAVQIFVQWGVAAASETIRRQTPDGGADHPGPARVSWEGGYVVQLMFPSSGDMGSDGWKLELQTDSNDDRLADAAALVGVGRPGDSYDGLQLPPMDDALRAVCAVSRPFRPVAMSGRTAVWAATLHRTLSGEGKGKGKGDGGHDSVCVPLSVPRAAELPPWGLWGAYVAQRASGGTASMPAVEVLVCSQTLQAKKPMYLPLCSMDTSGSILLGGASTGLGLESEKPNWRQAADGAALVALLPRNTGAIGFGGNALQGSFSDVFACLSALVLAEASLESAGVKVDFAPAAAVCDGFIRCQQSTSGDANGLVEPDDIHVVSSPPAAKRPRNRDNHGGERRSVSMPLSELGVRGSALERVVVGLHSLRSECQEGCMSGLTAVKFLQTALGSPVVPPLAWQYALLASLSIGVAGALRRGIARGLAAVLRAAGTGKLEHVMGHSRAGADAMNRQGGGPAGHNDTGDRARARPVGSESKSRAQQWAPMDEAQRGVLRNWRMLPLELRAGTRVAAAATCRAGVKAVRAWQGGPGVAGSGTIDECSETIAAGSATERSRGGQTVTGAGAGTSRSGGTLAEWGLLGWDASLRVSAASSRETESRTSRGVSGWAGVVAAALGGMTSGGQEGAQSRVVEASTQEQAAWSSLAALLAWCDSDSETGGGVHRAVTEGTTGGGYISGTGIGMWGDSEGPTEFESGLGLSLGLGDNQTPTGPSADRSDASKAMQEAAAKSGRREAGSLHTTAEESRELAMAVAVAVAASREAGLHPSATHQSDWLSACSSRLSEDSLLVRRAAWGSLLCLQSRQGLLQSCGERGLITGCAEGGADKGRMLVQGTKSGLVLRSMPRSGAIQQELGDVMSQTVLGGLWADEAREAVHRALLHTLAPVLDSAAPDVSRQVGDVAVLSRVRDQLQTATLSALDADGGAYSWDRSVPWGVVSAATVPVSMADLGPCQSRGTATWLEALCASPVPITALETVLMHNTIDMRSVMSTWRGVHAFGSSDTCSPSSLETGWRAGLALQTSAGRITRREAGSVDWSQRALMQPSDPTSHVSLMDAARILQHHLEGSGIQGAVLDSDNAPKWSQDPLHAIHGAAGLGPDSGSRLAFILRTLVALASPVGRRALRGVVLEAAQKEGACIRHSTSEPGLHPESSLHVRWLLLLGDAVKTRDHQAANQAAVRGSNSNEAVEAGLASAGVAWAASMSKEQEVAALWRCATACWALGLQRASASMAAVASLQRGISQSPDTDMHRPLIHECSHVVHALAIKRHVDEAWAVASAVLKVQPGRSNTDMPPVVRTLVDAMVQTGATRELSTLPLPKHVLAAAGRSMLHPSSKVPSHDEPYEGGMATMGARARTAAALLLRAKDGRGAASVAWAGARMALARGCSILRLVARGGVQAPASASLGGSLAAASVAMQEAAHLALLAVTALRSEPDSAVRWLAVGGSGGSEQDRMSSTGNTETMESGLVPVPVDLPEAHFVGTALDALYRCTKAASVAVKGKTGGSASWHARRGGNPGGRDAQLIATRAQAQEAKLLLPAVPMLQGSAGTAGASLLRGVSIRLEQLVTCCIRVGQLPAGRRVAAASAAWGGAASRQLGRATAAEASTWCHAGDAVSQEARVSRAAAVLGWRSGQQSSSGKTAVVAAVAAADAAVPAIVSDATPRLGHRHAAASVSGGGAVARVLVRAGRPAEALGILLPLVPSTLAELRDGMGRASLPQGAIDEALQAAEAVEVLGSDASHAGAVRASRRALLARLFDAGWASAEGAQERRAAYVGGMAIGERGRGNGGSAKGVVGVGAAASLAASALRPRQVRGQGLGRTGMKIIRGFAGTVDTTGGIGGGDEGRENGSLGALATALVGRSSADLPIELLRAC